MSIFHRKRWGRPPMRSSSVCANGWKTGSEKCDSTHTGFSAGASPGLTEALLDALLPKVSKVPAGGAVTAVVATQPQPMTAGDVPLTTRSVVQGVTHSYVSSLLLHPSAGRRAARFGAGYLLHEHGQREQREHARRGQRHARVAGQLQQPASHRIRHRRGGAAEELGGVDDAQP